MTEAPVPFCPRLRNSAGFLSFAREARAESLKTLRHRVVQRSTGPYTEETLRELIAESLLLDFIEQGWQVQVTDDQVSLLAPATVVGDPLAEKARIRQAQLVERDKYLQRRPIRDFIASMERRRLTNTGWHSIFSLMRDGMELASLLRETKEGAEGQQYEEALSRVISPYIQVAEPGTTCKLTGLDLGDIWRYFRLTWVNAPKSVPGRSMMFLVRDAAAPNHPVIGIAALGSSVVQQQVRDLWIGWDANTFVQELARNPTAKLGRWLLESLDDHIAALYIKDLVAEDLIARRHLKHPTMECINQLRKEGLLARERHGRNAQLEIHRSHARDWKVRVTTHLFRAKRCESLARLLSIRLAFNESGIKTASKAELTAACADSKFVAAVGQLIRINKAEHVGINMMDITVCGSIAPYSHLLGGKLVCSMLFSPEVVRSYRKRYDQESIIASCMLGASVKRTPRLVLLGTTSLYGIGASQYNRIKIPLADVGGTTKDQLKFEALGHSLGYGSYHVSPETSQLMDALIARQEGGGRKVNRLFGEGVNPRMRMIRQAMELLNLPSSALLRHGNTRVIYGVPLARNFREVLIGLAERPAYFLPLTQSMDGSEALARFWRKRWLAPRVSRQGILDAVAEHTLTYPVKHGARVLTVEPGIEEDRLPFLLEV